MLRSLKYGIFGVILAGLVVASIAWRAVDKSVTLVVDGKTQTFRTSAADVGQLLANRGYHVDGHDLVAPASGATLHDGMRVVLRRGRLLHLSVDGTRRDVWTTARTVAAALAQLNYPASDSVSVSRSQRLPLGASSLTIRTPRAVTVIVDGQQRTVTTTDATVAELLGDLGVTVGSHDQVRPQLDTAMSDGAVIRVRQVVGKTVARREPIGSPTPRRTDAHVLSGHARVVHPAKQAPVRHHRIAVGGPRYGLGRAAAAARAIARQMVVPRGWGQDQYHCLLILWFHESSWRVHAYNPNSGAYGIPQALPAYKLASAGPAWRADAATQIRWGLHYIASRYGTPCNAWYEWQAHGGWY